MCTRQSRKVIWDMINTLFLTLQLSNLLFLLSLSTHKHMSMVSRVILSNFFKEQWTQNHPQYLSGLCTFFPTTFLEIAVVGFNYSYCSGGSRGGPLIFRPNRDPNGRKKVFWDPPPPYLRAWMTGLPPYLKVWIRHCSVKQFLDSYNYDVGFSSENKNLLEKNPNILKLL